MAGLIDRAIKSTPVWKFAGIVGGTTLTIWTPRSGSTILLTGLDVSLAGANTGTVYVFFGTTANNVGKSIAQYSLTTTTTINPRFSGLSVGPDVLVQALSTGNNAFITAYGFEE